MSEARRGRGSVYVDYERVARRYREGRELPSGVIDRWGAVVRRHLGSCLSARLRVVDVGAGTGIFARAWPQWSPGALVVAVEPAAAMVCTGRLDLHPDRHRDVQYILRVAEQLPLRDGGMDVVWVSAALHHFADLPRAAAEVGRVLADAGRLLVRTYLPERTEVSWIAEFAGRRRADRRFHTVDQLAALFRPHGLVVTEVAEVFEFDTSYAEAADWVEQMRHADSWLGALTDQEIAAGVRALRSEPTRLARNDMSLIILRRA